MRIEIHALTYLFQKTSNELCIQIPNFKMEKKTKLKRNNNICQQFI